RRSGQKAPAAEVSAVHLRVQLEHFRGIVLRIDRDGSECDLAAEITPEPILHQRHHRRPTGQVAVQRVKMKVTATTLPRRFASEISASSCEVSVNPGAGAIFGSGWVQEAAS